LGYVVFEAKNVRFGPRHATGLTRSTDDVRHKNSVLDHYCMDVGRDPRCVLRTHLTSWLMLASIESAARAKLAQYYTDKAIRMSICR
jgi:hypothetical protein